MDADKEVIFLFICVYLRFQLLSSGTVLRVTRLFFRGRPSMRTWKE
jgi:hypothetical protein